MQDILAVTALIDGLSQQEIGKAAELVGLSRSDFIDGLRQAAQGGLVDVANTYSHRVYYTRPPMLATVLAAERVFAEQVPSFSVEDLLKSWPDKASVVFRKTVVAARVGASEARRRAGELFTSLVDDGLPIEAATEYAMLDGLAANQVVELLDAVPRPFDAYRSSSICRGYAVIAYRYNNPQALTALLDLAVGDERPPHSYPEHPYRLIKDYVTYFSPEVGHPFERRGWTLDIATEWLRPRQAEDARAVYAEVVKASLSPTLSGQNTHPGHVNTLQLREAVLSASLLARLEDEIWPKAIGMADEGGEQLKAVLVSVAAEWLALGEGVSSSIASPSPDAREQAANIGARMLQLVAAQLSLSVGLRVKVSNEARDHGVLMPVTMVGPPEEWRPFFVEYDPLYFASIDNLREFEATFRAWGARQATRSPVEVAHELAVIVDELGAAGITWPDPVTAVLAGIADTANNLTEWLTAAVDGGLATKAYVFVPAVFKQGEMTIELCRDYLASSYLRCVTITTVLGSSDDECPILDLVVNEVEPSDYRCLFTMLLRQEEAPGVPERLMDHPRDDVRGMVAYAYWLASRHHKHDTPFPPVWFEAIEKLRAQPFGYSHDDYAVPDLILYMDKKCRPNLLRLLSGQFADIAATRGLANARDTWWSKLSQLSPEVKSVLWELFKHDAVARNILDWNLAGDDVTWLAAELEAGRLSTVDVLRFASGLAQSPSLETLARLLIPRGVDPLDIAVRAELADSWGESSERYQKLVDRFTELAQSDDEYVRQLGEVGVNLFANQRDTAATEERRRRIRGEF